MQFDVLKRKILRVLVSRLYKATELMKSQFDLLELILYLEISV